jgi:uncharacterized repeat protein (TIGR03806 family)
MPRWLQFANRSNTRRELACFAMTVAYALLPLVSNAQTSTRIDRPAVQAPSNLPAHATTHRLPEQFRAVDTRRLMGSPQPLPLEAVRAFPNLSFERPVEATYAHASDDRLFVVEQRGVIYVFNNHEDVSEKQVFLDIRDVVSRDGNEEGLLGLAFHPNFDSNQEFFVYYSTRPRSSILARFKVSTENRNQADRQSEQQLLQIDQPYSNHNGGSIRFGPDGKLYIGLGDGGLADDPHVHAQNLATMLGSILRIDIDNQDEELAYAIPRDNPFVDRADARGEIWAYGLRNVWRMAFDKNTGELWAADVGQDRVEEINLIVKGGNYGWNIREGFQPFDPNVPHKPTDLIDPLVEYSRQDGQSVTGGLVYRGSDLPAFQGAYFFGDYLSGNVWALRTEGGRVTKHRLVAETGLEIAAFGEDAAGKMLLCAFDGNLYKLQPRDIDLEAVAAAFPKRLSDTGLFASVADNIPQEGLIPYELNLPFWSDYTVKDRYIALPEQGAIDFDEQAKWGFPVGTVFVKTFWMHMDRTNFTEPKRLETRLLIRAPHGWEPHTYIYNDEQTEAHLLDGSMIKPIEVRTHDGVITQPYYFPSRSDCFACHTAAEGFVLGMTTRQMNHTLEYRGDEENQISMLDRLRVFQNSPERAVEELEAFPKWPFGNFDRSRPSAGNGANRNGDGSEHANRQSGESENRLKLPDGDKDELARAWLEVNCAVCHRPEGIAPHSRDMRFHANPAEMRLVGEEPSQGQLGPPGTELIKPGAPNESELFLRMSRRGPRQMPPVSSKIVDPIGHAVIRDWIMNQNGAR